MKTHAYIALLVLLASAPALPGEWDLTGFVGAEGRWFVDDPQFDGQFSGLQGSLIFEPSWEFESEGRRQQVTLTPFLRLDSRDGERTHFDLREGYWRYVVDDWELTAGVNSVFWGVTESRHLVNVVNQVDQVEDIDREDWLGQPMVQLALQRDWGRLEGLALIGFREPTFVGREGRLRAPLPVDKDGAIYESSKEQRRIDLALRYSHYFGDWDVGLHAFHGNGREPSLLPAPTGDRLLPLFNVTNQIGTDVQYTRGAWLWKLEALGRQGQGDTFGAAVGGFEYTFYQTFGSAADVGLLAEYLYDGRDPSAPPVVGDDDVFVGSRLAFNDAQDTQLLVGGIVDREDRSVAGFIEAGRRIGQRYRVELETRWFLNVDSQNVLRTFEQDSFVALRLSRWF